MGPGFVVNSPVPGGNRGLNEPASVRLSPNKKMLVNCAEALLAASASATAVAAIDHRKRCMTNISLEIGCRIANRCSEPQILFHRSVTAAAVNVLARTDVLESCRKERY